MSGTRRHKSPARLRARRQRRRRVLKVFEAALCLGVIGAFAYYFVQYAQGSTDFSVQRVAIHGLHHLSEDLVFEQSGITRAGNVFRFDESAVKVRLEELPYVESCDVARVYPDTVAVRVEERVPVASLLVHRKAYEIDRHGVVLREYGPLEMPMAPFISGDGALEFVSPGDTVRDPAVLAALDVWEAFRAGPISQHLTVSELAALHPNDIRMYCNETRYEIRWGRGDLDRRVQRLLVLWTQMNGDIGCEAYLDLRFGADVPCK